MIVYKEVKEVKPPNGVHLGRGSTIKGGGSREGKGEMTPRGHISEGVLLLREGQMR